MQTHLPRCFYVENRAFLFNGFVNPVVYLDLVDRMIWWVNICRVIEIFEIFFAECMFLDAAPEDFICYPLRNLSCERCNCISSTEWGPWLLYRILGREGIARSE